MARQTTAKKRERMSSGTTTGLFLRFQSGRYQVSVVYNSLANGWYHLRHELTEMGSQV